MTRLLTETEAAEALKVCTRTLRKERQAGRLAYVLIGRAVRYTMDDLDRFIETAREIRPPCPQPRPAAQGKPARGKRRGAEIIPFSARNAV